MIRLTDEELLEIWNSNQCTSDDLPLLRAVADAAVAAYIKQKGIELPVAKRWKAEVPKSQGGGHIWVYISRDEKVPEGTYAEPLFTHPHYPVKPKHCVNHEKCQALANAVLNDMDCHPAFVKAMAADIPVKKEMAVPEGYALVPKELTAENGAKYVLMGEFHVRMQIRCGCDEDADCELCDSENMMPLAIPVEWETIKKIWKAGIAHFAAQKELDL